MKLSELQPAVGSKTKAYRKGRGHGSGNGKTAGKGHKGQNARAGGGVRLGFEGGQMPMYRRLPKRGFKCINTKDIVALNVKHLEQFENDSVIDFDVLKSKGLVSKLRDGLKILGNGDLTKKLTVRANFFSKSAIEKIESIGGKAEVI